MELNKIFHQDCLDFLRSIESNTVDLVITSPPYNRNLHRNIKKNGKWQFVKLQYDNYDDNMPEDEYEKWQRTVIEECIRVLKPSGSLFYNHKENKKNGFAINPTFIYDFPLHQTIIWQRNASISTNINYFVSSFEYLFWIVKDHKKTYFNRNASSLRTNVWKINAEKNLPHPAPFPLQLAEQIIITCCPPGGLVLDCFMGSGTTAVASVMNRRSYIGSEISDKYIDIANKRIKEIL